MQKKRGKFPILFKIILPLVPLALAYIAYYYIYTHRQPDAEYLVCAQLEAFYSAIRVYSISLDKPGGMSLAEYGEPIRILLEVARWGAMFVMATVVIKLLQTSLQTMYTSLVAANKRSIALYGDAAPVAQMKDELGALAITRDNPVRFRAANHVLAFRDTNELYRFLNAHQDGLRSRKGARIFLYSSDPLHPAVIQPQVYIHNMAEACARTYWKKNWLRPEESQIVIVGSNAYAEALLTYALQTNVFLSRGEIEYHAFGDWRRYRALHPGLANVAALNAAEPGRDAVYLHEDGWQEQLPLLRHAHRVILCMDEDDQNMRLLDTLLERRAQGRVYIRIGSPRLLGLFGIEDSERAIVPFGTDQELFALDQVTNATTLSKGRLMNASYYRDSCPTKCAACKGGEDLIHCLNCPEYIEHWNHSSAYYRSSSVAQGDHIAIKIRELLHSQADDALPLGEDAYKAFLALDDGMKKRYLELEHERWMRYMYLHGWRYSPTRNDAEMEHNLLVPFDELSEDEQTKDCQPYYTLHNVARYAKFKKELLRHV